jgi:serine/threonine protein kinase
MNIIHRDIKLANILLHFPENPEIGSMDAEEKSEFLKNFDFANGNFQTIISDFGMSTIVQIGSDGVLTICGTPLYSSPELLKKKGYSYKVDIWAIGIMCYELLMGRTPFHSKKLVELLARINKGDYAIALDDEPVSIECAMFLVNCM